jgi:apolipoprotein N-acyltransferase
MALSWLHEEWAVAAWISLTLFFLGVGATSTLRGAAAGYLFGVCALAASFHWAPTMLARTFDADRGELKPRLVFAAMTAWEAIPFALLGLVAARAARGMAPSWVPACTWVAAEHFWPRVFPWSLAHTQTGAPIALQTAELGGAALVSFLMVLVTYDAARRVRTRDVTLSWPRCVAPAAFAVALAFGAWRLTQFHRDMPDARALRVGVVQVEPYQNDSIDDMRAHTDAMGESVDLVAWPESSLGSYSTSVTNLAQIKRSLRIAHPPFIDVTGAKDLGSWLLVGGKTFAPGADEEGPFMQSAFLIDPAGEFRARYYKRRLMPIGEYVPYEDRWPQLHEWAALTEYIGVGESDAPLRVEGGPAVGVLLCYEDIVGALARRTVVEGAELLVCLINGSAFEDAIALQQHRRLATLRAVENRRTLVRSAGTGQSCAISPAGEIMAELPLNADGHFVVAAPLADGLTLYARGGYLFPQACVLYLVASPVFARVRRWTRVPKRAGEKTEAMRLDSELAGGVA